MKRAYHFKILWLMRRTAGDIWDFDRIMKVDKREFKAVTSYGLSRQRWLIIAEKQIRTENEARWSTKTVDHSAVCGINKLFFFSERLKANMMTRPQNSWALPHLRRSANTDSTYLFISLRRLISHRQPLTVTVRKYTRMSIELNDNVHAAGQKELFSFRCIPLTRGT